MATMKQSSARTRIDIAEAAEIARMARSGDPNLVSREDIENQLGDSALVLDGLRRRPHYFDGRFLTGADLTRDQDYIRQRQADLARATGTGVVSGLEVSLAGSPGGELLSITPGHGVTPAGDIVMVATRRSIAPLDLPAVERLDATLGLRLSPRMPLGRRSGLFLLALRAVEFTANPIAAYPTSITGPRQVEDADIIEATAITLIPFPDTGGAATLAEARRAVARRVFLGEAEGLPQDALPLAMIALERGSIRWIDTAMVRRETGADTPLQVGMGARPRALSEAFVVQHRRHLRDVLADRAAGGLPPAFAAAQYFAALPAAGQLPATAILTDPLGFRQLWFPPAVDVDLSFVPSDELPALVEESLTLPPIDLLGDPQDLDATGVVVLAPVTRQRLQTFERALAQLTIRAVSDPAQGIRRPPAQMLAALLARRGPFGEAAQRDSEARARAEAADAETRTWQAAWAEAVAAIPPEAEGLPPLLWYIRRRAVPYQSRVAGIAVAVSGDDEELNRVVASRLAALGLDSRVAAVRNRATPFAEARVLSFLGTSPILEQPSLTANAVRDLEAALPPAPPTGGPGTTPPIVPRPPAEIRLTGGARPGGPTAPLAPSGGGQGIRTGAGRLTLTRLILARAGKTAEMLSEGDVIAVASDYSDPRLGEGLERLSAALAAEPLDRPGVLWIGDNDKALDLDRAARNVRQTALAAFAADVRAAVIARDADTLTRLIAEAE